MIEVTVPDYYNDFRCIADKCPDNCCIGWEIDIDDKSYQTYLSYTGALKEEMDRYITLSEDGSRCFRLTEDQRCPFLNEHNLCRLIISKGEDALCDICANHPRFHNCFGNIRRTGVGISCIAAAELVLNKRDITKYVTFSSDEPSVPTDYDESFLQFVLAFEKRITEMLQDRSERLCVRINRTLELAAEAQYRIDGYEENNTADCDFTALFSRLIPLNDEWSEAIQNAAIKSYNDETALEQLAVYYIFRHLSSAIYDGDILGRVKLAVLCVIASVMVSDDDIVKASCLVSKEIEYCSENIDIILDAAYSDGCMSSVSLVNTVEKICGI